MLKLPRYSKKNFQNLQKKTGNKEHLISFNLTLVSLLVPLIILMQSCNKSHLQQTSSDASALATPTAPPDLNKQIEEEVKKQLNQRPGLNKKIEIEEEVKKQLNQRQTEFLNTVYLSILSTVITILFFGLGVQWYTAYVQLQTEKERIKTELWESILKQLNKRFEELDKEINERLANISVALKLIESQMYILSARQVYGRILGNPESIVDSKKRNIAQIEGIQAIEENIRSASLILEIENQNHVLFDESTKVALLYCLDAANDIVKYLDNQYKTDRISPYYRIEQISEIIEMLNSFNINNNNVMEGKINNIRNCLEEFERKASSH
jgi:hypothetical protein